MSEPEAISPEHPHGTYGLPYHHEDGDEHRHEGVTDIHEDGDVPHIHADI